MTVTLTMNRDGANKDFVYIVEAPVNAFVAYSKLFFPLRNWTFVAVDVSP